MRGKARDGAREVLGKHSAVFISQALGGSAGVTREGKGSAMVRERLSGRGSKPTQDERRKKEKGVQEEVGMEDNRKSSRVKNVLRLFFFFFTQSQTLPCLYGFLIAMTKCWGHERDRRHVSYTYGTRAFPYMMFT